ncbi:MAG: uracil-DNA glycosylase [Nitrospirota bacterium]
MKSEVRRLRRDQSSRQKSEKRREEIDNIIGDFKNYILFLKGIGVDKIYRTKGTVPERKTPHLSPLPGGERVGVREVKGQYVEPGLSPEESLRGLRKEIGDCKRCKLYKGRRNIVFGIGNPSAEIVFVGEAPGRDEDIQGEPFVGEAGQLLTKIINAMGMERDEVYIANVIKCRPPDNRNPEKDEIDACEPFLSRQLRAIKPLIICTLGTFASQTLLKRKEKISALRGNFYDYNGIPVMPTYHPAYLLRNQQDKRLVWEDIQKVMDRHKKLKGNR